MSKRVVCRRLVGRTMHWGFDSSGRFFPFGAKADVGAKADAEKAAATWSDEFVRRMGGFRIESCPLADVEDGVLPCG